MPTAPDELFLPPIFIRNPGLRLVGRGRTDRGHPFLKFTNLDDQAPVREVAVIFVTTNKPASIHYDYSYIDADGLISAHSGPYGDPDQDRGEPWGVIQGS